MRVIRIGERYSISTDEFDKTFKSNKENDDQAKLLNLNHSVIDCSNSKCEK